MPSPSSGRREPPTHSSSSQPRMPDVSPEHSVLGVWPTAVETEVLAMLAVPSDAAGTSGATGGATETPTPTLLTVVVNGNVRRLVGAWQVAIGAPIPVGLSTLPTIPADCAPSIKPPSEEPPVLEAKNEAAVEAKNEEPNCGRG